jgi:formylglycine-generating enzyme required for sulfatase activity
MSSKLMHQLIAFALAAGLPAVFACAAQPTRVEKIPGTTSEFTLVEIPAGKMEIQIEKVDAAPRTVEFKKKFHMGKHEVTWDEFDTFAFSLDLSEEEKQKDDALEDKALRSRPSKPYSTPDHGYGHNVYAAISMTRKSAEKYCEWLSKKTGKKFRLPTEEEWEYACRAGGAHKTLEGAELDKFAWHKENATTDMHPDGSPHPIGKKEPNEWGLHDMLGNVVEWVTTADGKLVARGGSWDHSPSQINCSKRFPQTARWNVTDPQDPKSTWWLSDGKFVGFRVVCEE